MQLKPVGQEGIGLLFLTCKSSRSTLNYTHLTQDERYQIQALHHAGHSISEIARQLHRSASTILRELKRNCNSTLYWAAQAQKLADSRQLLCRNALTISPQKWLTVEAYLRLHLSPQQVAGRLEIEGVMSISPETIYQYVYRDKAQGGDLASYLRCQKARRKRYGSGRQRRGVLKNRVGIEQRPCVVAIRERLGDWEGDTVIGRGHSGVLVTLVERKSRFTLARCLPKREAEPVSAAIIEMLRAHKTHCLTITFDNGKEFAQHQFIASCLAADVYFARPYHSWERGTNENTNGLLRQYFPKKMSFADLSQTDVDDATYRLNHRPRKCLQYRTPHEVFYNLPQQSLN
jgi:IS30 family transposase